MWVLNSRTPHSFSPVLCCQQNSSVVTFHIEILPTNIFKYKLFYDSIAHTPHEPNVFEKEKRKKAKGGKITNRRHKLEIFGCCCWCAAVCWAALYRWWFLCKLAKWVSWSRYFLACSLTLLLYHTLFILLRVFFCLSVFQIRFRVFVFDRRCFSASRHALQSCLIDSEMGGTRMLCTREHGTQYIKKFSYLLTITTTTATATTNYTHTQEKKLNQSSIFYELFF